MGAEREVSEARPRVAYWPLAAIALLYVVPILVEPPDLPEYVYPWLAHIRGTNIVAAFAEPFGNYTPPYLYLLAAGSLLPLSPFLIVKGVAVASVVWLAWCASRLAAALGVEDRRGSAITALALPTVIFNGPALGQCDGIWVGCCLLSLGAAVDRRPVATAGWAGAGFAFKAQSAFFAPIALGVVLRERKWLALFVPLAIYLLAILPAFAAGWPLSDLLTIYLRQAGEAFEGNAPNLWALLSPFGLNWAASVGLVFAALAAILITVLSTRTSDAYRLALLALLAAIVLPFVLPQMHERYFFLADLIAFVLAFWRRDRLCIALCVLTQVASSLSIVAYLGPLPWLNVVAALVMAAALGLTIIAILRRRGDRLVPREC